jgi:hypothetical protein
MAVVTHVYTYTLNDMGTKAFTWTTDTMSVALFSADTFTAADVAYTTSGTEVANGNGYTTGGVSAGTRTLSSATTTPQLYKITGGSGTSTWTATGAGFTAVAAKVYDGTTTHPVANVDFGGSQTASGGGTFTITWDATNGLFNLASS